MGEACNTTNTNTTNCTTTTTINKKPQYLFDLPNENEVSGVLRKSKSQFAFFNAKGVEELKVAHYVAYKAITLPKLIEELINFPSAIVRKYLALTYRAFGTTIQCAELLRDRFNGPTGDFEFTQAQVDAFEAKKTLIQTRTREIALELINSLEQVDVTHIDRIRQALTPIFRGNSDVIDTLEKNIGISPRAAPRDRKLTRDEAVVLKSEFTSLLQLDVNDVACTITMKDMTLFRRIRPSELVTLAWNGKEPQTYAPNVCASTEYFNWVSTWMVAKLLTGQTAEERASIIEFFINVGLKFKEMYNYNGVMQVICSLNCVAVSRLKQSWELVPEQSKKSLAALELTMSTSHNSRVYRQELEKVPSDSPCLPFIGLFLTDIMFAASGNATFIGENMINTCFILFLGKVLASLQQYQSMAYDFGTVCHLQLEDHYGEKELYGLSHLREPSVSAASSPTTRKRSGSVSRTPVARNSSFIPNQDFVPRVSGLSEEDFAVLISNSELHMFNAGETILCENDLNRKLYLIEDGEVGLYKRPYRDPIITLQTRNIFNIVSFTGDNSGSWATAQARTDTRVYVILEEVARNLLIVDSMLNARYQRYFGRHIAMEIRLFMDVKLNPHSPVSADAAKGTELYDNSEVFDEESGSPPKSSQRNSGQYSRKTTVVIKSFTCKSGSMHPGKLTVTHQHTLFHSKVFGFVKRHTVDNEKVASVRISHCTVSLQTLGEKPCKFTFKNEAEAVEAKALFDRVCKTSAEPAAPENAPATTVDSTLMQEEEWKLLLKGVQCQTFPKGTVLLKEGSKCKSLIQIVEGKCAVQKMTDMIPKTLAIREHSVLGEMCFLDENQVASASVVAETDVTAYVIGASYVHILLHHHSDMAPKFYKYLASLMAQRLCELDEVTVPRSTSL